jgi:hypothetical protein
MSLRAPLLVNRGLNGLCDCLVVLRWWLMGLEGLMGLMGLIGAMFSLFSEPAALSL